MNVHMPMPVREQWRLEVVQTGEQLTSVGPAWAQLWSEVDGLVFQSPAWVSAWWNTLPIHHRHALRIGLIWQGDKLRAVLPLVVTRRMGLRFLEWAAIACTDYPDILAAPDCPPEKLEALWVSLLAAGGFDIVQLALLLPDAKMRTVIASGETGKIRLQPGHRSEVSCRVVGDFSGEGGWLAQQSKKTRQNYRRGHKLLEENAAVCFRLLDPSSDQLGPVVEQFYRLKRKWLIDTDRESELLEADTGAVPALVDVLKTLGILRIFVIERSSEIVAMSINFEQRGAMMAFLTTFDPAYEKASPGAVLIMDYIQWSAKHGLQTVDFLRGAEGFKFRFATQTVTLETMVGARTILGHAAMFANRIRLRLRRKPVADESEADAAKTPAMASDIVPAS